ncbi:MAG: adenylate/guanylate cyclase domain-containing protein [Bdellovibrionota bacterium]
MPKLHSLYKNTFFHTLKNIGKYQTASSLNIFWALMVGGFWLIASLLLQHSSGGTYLDEKLARPIDFRARAFFKQNPIISEKLKILVLDDSAFAALDTWVLPIEQWATLLSAIDARHPQNIFIDKLWSKIVDPNQKADLAIESLKTIKTPITVAASASIRKVPFRYDLNMGWKDFQLKEKVSSNNTAQLPTLPNYNNYSFFGPTYKIAEVISHIGHVVYRGNGRIAPLLHVDFAKAIPHAFLFSAKHWSFKNGMLDVDGKKLTLDDEGFLPVNFFPHESDLYKNRTIMSLKYFLNRAQKGMPLDLINAGDTVLILPLFYTGNTDFKWTPFGDLPAGIVPAALINSTLTGQWLKPYNNHTLLISVAVIAGILTAGALHSLAYWCTLVLLTTLIPAIAIIIFSYFAIEIPWMTPLIAFTASNLTIHAKKSLLAEKKARAIRQALEGAINASELDNILKNPHLIDLEPKERVLSLVFIDIVGFSLVSENMIPRHAFETLKEILGEASTIIHDHGGIVDKTLGDGLLAYFGYSFRTGQTIEQHAQAAIAAATAIQEKSIERSIKNAKKNEVIMPLRIGINTATCFLGNLGSGQRIEFTVIGNGVNFAKRLEGACDIYSIMISATTKNLIENSEINPLALTAKMINIKHHKNAIAAFDYNPFYENTSKKVQATLAYKNFCKPDRRTKRIKLQPGIIQVSTDFGIGTVLNFSLSGMSLLLPIHIEKGKIFKLNIESEDSSLGNRLKEIGITNLSAEVRWSGKAGNNFEHGLLLTTLSFEQRNGLFDCLAPFSDTRPPEAI